MVKKFPDIPCPKCGKFGLESPSGEKLGEGDVICTASGCKLTVHDETRAFNDFAARGRDKALKALKDKNKFT